VILCYGASMKLHHHSGKPDWEMIAPAERTPWQRLAANTRGFVTPANVVSLVGLGLVLLGLAVLVKHRYIAGLWLIVIGRLCDIIDGAIADRSGTKSPLGEVVDAGFDKLGALGVLIVFGVEHIVPWWAIIGIGIQNAANAIIGFVGHHRKLSVHPVRAGKISTACEWLAFFCFILAAAYGSAWAWPAYGILGAALVLGLVSTSVYARSVWKKTEKQTARAPMAKSGPSIKVGNVA
jgi:phosphatidylglycerophosphate synthase